MMWVPASNGQLPDGLRPVEGGYEAAGQHLFHAVAQIDGVWVPGKAGQHLFEGSAFAFGGHEVSRRDYQVLCWRE